MGGGGKLGAAGGAAAAAARGSRLAARGSAGRARGSEGMAMVGGGGCVTGGGGGGSPPRAQGSEGITHVPTLRNFADLLTKCLSGKKRRDLVRGVLFDIYGIIHEGCNGGAKMIEQGDYFAASRTGAG